MSGKRVFKHLSGVETTAGTTNIPLNPPSGYLYSVIYAVAGLATGTGTGTRSTHVQGVLMGDVTGATPSILDIAGTGNQTTTSTNYTAYASFWVNSNPSGGSGYLLRGPVIIWPTLSVSTGRIGLMFQSVLISGDSASYDVLVEVIPYSEG